MQQATPALLGHVGRSEVEGVGCACRPPAAAQQAAAGHPRADANGVDAVALVVVQIVLQWSVSVFASFILFDGCRQSSPCRTDGIDAMPIPSSFRAILPNSGKVSAIPRIRSVA